MSLKEYFKKRDFEATPEPKGGKAKEGDQLRFVIQRHHASRLHYDLRLEMHGTLKSWAVPKGPSMNPEDKRLAIQTEDHPIDYLYFEGNIPKGNYGAGNMVIWDTGYYEPAYGKNLNDLSKQFSQGNLKIAIHGNKVKGTFSLVKTKRGEAGNQWLFMKKKDGYALDIAYDAEEYIDYESDGNRDILPGFYKPMLATKTDHIFNKPDWIYELKWDGYRALASVQKGKVHLYSRNGISFKDKFSEIYESLKDIPHDTVLDGEIVSLNEGGVSVFQALQNYPNDKEGELRYYVFDILHLNGHDTTSLTLLERKSLIPDVIEGIGSVYYCDHIEGMGSVFYQKAIDSGMEGVIAKKAGSTYSPGMRTESWLKVKSHERQEVIICGYTLANDGGAGFGSLILGVFEGDLLRYVGNCGSGFDEETIRALLALFEPLQAVDSPFGKKINLKGRKPVWLKPEMICEVKFSKWTKSGHMRHPVYKGLRMDKIPTEIEKENSKNSAKPSGSKNTNTNGGGSLELDGVSVPVSNLDKVYWPKENFTKYDLINYYLQVGETMLPYLMDRPQNMHRHPEGINGEGFYHKDTSGIFPHWIETQKVHSKSKEDSIEYLLCQNEATLLYMANLGCIEINPWISRKESLDSPDYTVIDLDPSSKNTFEEVIEVAQAVKEVLDRGGVKGYCKTSGSSGLHIYLPLAPGYSYDEARDFTKLLCYYVQELVPDITSMERSVKKRNDKIYLDFMQNRKGQTLAAPYCARPKPGATVSAPLHWDEVKTGLKMGDFTIKSVPERLEKIGDLFEGVLREHNNIESVLTKLSEEL
ncbi:DNA ligase D [Anditalea andensis]|uniref:DNA ligase (ATP) n=1 Tax=Anditalea andensis TaxID=1048983 RepID=A0A074L4X6_9BACT|nr:DNA ligase D [Anditalea andensis]KEO75530.1 ATP-dependent DNA ligase [Anditalea andensis]